MTRKVMVCGDCGGREVTESTWCKCDYCGKKLTTRSANWRAI